MNQHETAKIVAVSGAVIARLLLDHDRMLLNFHTLPPLQPTALPEALGGTAHVEKLSPTAACAEQGTPVPDLSTLSSEPHCLT
jgi:hypothetical protein